MRLSHAQSNTGARIESLEKWQDTFTELGGSGLLVVVVVSMETVTRLKVWEEGSKEVHTVSSAAGQVFFVLIVAGL